jgi:hypothetical protein
MKILNVKASLDAKTGTVKEMNMNFEEQENKKVKKRMIIDYIN